MRSRPLAGIAAALALALALSTAGAADPKVEAQALLTEGNQLVGEGEYLGALKRFREAYALYPSPKILLNEATTLRQLGRNVEAAAIYEKYLADPSADAAKAPEVRRVLEELDALVAHLRVQANVAGAAVRLDGASLDDPSASRRVPTGPHVVVGEHAGYSPSIVAIRLVAGETRTVTLSLSNPGERRILVTAPATPGATQRALGGGAVALGALSLGLGVVFAVVAHARVSDAEDACGKASVGDAWVCGAKGSALFSQADGFRTAANVTSIAGVAVLAGGLTLIFTAPRKAPAPRVGLVPATRGAPP